MTSERGFTLVEMVTAIVIISIMSLMTIPKIAATIANLRLDAAASKMISDLHYVREMALSRHGTYGLEVNQAGNSYTFFFWDGSSKTTMTDPHKRTAMSVDYDNQPEYSGVTISAIDFCEGVCTTEEVRIDAFGVPSDASGNAFTSVATVTLQSGSSTKTIQVTPETAFVEIV